MPRVYTGGTFDLFHRGHVNLLKACSFIAGPGGWVVVSLNTDEFIESYKGRPPVVGYDDREAVLWACRYVDQVIPNIGGADSKPAIERARPDIIVVGSDWRGRDYHAQMGFTEEWLKERRIELMYVEYTAGISSSMIRGQLSPKASSSATTGETGAS